MSWGATTREWEMAIKSFGVERLLPVVSNPEAPISPDSNMKGVGKTPSRYNANRQVVGIAKWTEKVGTDAAVALWRKEPDYGICVQTGGGLYGIDIDVEDKDTAYKYATQITDAFGLDHFIYRHRENSGRLLLPIRVAPGLDGEAEFARYRSLTVPGGAIDILGDGKQFVAFGTHTSGSRYLWGIGVRRASERFMRLRGQFDGSDLA